MLWIIAAIAGAILLAGVAFLALDRDGDSPKKPKPEARPEPKPPRSSMGPWDQRSDEPPGSRLASVPPPSGVPMHHYGRAEMSSELTLESQEL